MKHTNTQTSREAGFTLVELAIVMIIIGILIGGILKGQELIANARVASTASSMKGMQAASDTFFDKFNSMAGDMVTAATRLPNCNGAAAAGFGPCFPGDGNGVINQGVGAAPAAQAAGLAGENTGFSVHLQRADLITGLDGTAGLSFGQELPTAPIGGGYWAGSVSAGAAAPAGFDVNDFRNGTYLVQSGVAAVVAAGTGILSAGQAASIDRKLDDGLAGSGNIISDSSAGAGNCLAAANGVYNEADASSVCSLAYRLR